MWIVSKLLDTFAERVIYNRPSTNIPEQIETIKYDFPKNNNYDLTTYYGVPGSNHISAKSPYALLLAWDTNVKINKFTVNKRIKKNVEQAMVDILEYYGGHRISELGLNLFGGCYNNRNIRGGTRLSTHAFACSIDWHPSANRLRWNKSKAVFAKKEYKTFLDIWQDHGAISLGRKADYDWMHIQFTNGV